MDGELHAMAHAEAAVPSWAPGYCHGTEDVDALQAAGVGAFRQQRHQMPRKGNPRYVDLSLLSGIVGPRDGEPRLDPGGYSMPAGRTAKDFRGKSIIGQDDTDPITHFQHLKTQALPRKTGRKVGYSHGAADQTWTWSQDKKVVESLHACSKAKSPPASQRYAMGADGQKYFNMFGREDLLPAASRDYIKCDIPVKQKMISDNDRAQLAYMLREGENEQRPVHNYFDSDDMWAVFRHDSNGKKVTIIGMNERRELSPTFSEDDPTDLPRREYKENDLPTRSPRNAALMGPQKRHYDWCEDGVRPDIPKLDPKSRMESPLADARGKSMTPVSVSRGNATPRSMTPRSSIAASDMSALNTQDIRPKPVPYQATPSATPRSGVTPRSMMPRSSTPAGRDLTPIGRTPQGFDFTPRDNASAPGNVTPRGDVTPRGGVTPTRGATPRRNATSDHFLLRGDTTPRGNATPRGNLTPRGDATPRGNTTPRGNGTPRGSSSVPGLSMMPQLIRRDATPRTGRVSLRKCASEVAISQNSWC